MASAAAATALRPMLSLAREETAVLSAELAGAGRVAIESAATTGVKTAVEMNPLAVRQAVEVGVKETMGMGSGGVLGMRQAVDVTVKEGANATTLLSRQAMEASVKDAAVGESLLTQHLSLAPKPPATSLIESALNMHPSASSSSSLISNSLSSSRSMVTSTVEQDLGQTMKEVLSNAGQTGVEEQMDQVLEVAKVWLCRELRRGVCEMGVKVGLDWRW